MYTILKLAKTQSMPAINLLNLLIVIMGLRDPLVETIDPHVSVQNSPEMSEAFTCGHFDPDGSLKFREREVSVLFRHFEPLRMNRRVQRREFASIHKLPAHVRSASELSFQPLIDKNSAQLAEVHKQKRGLGGFAGNKSAS